MAENNGQNPPGPAQCNQDDMIITGRTDEEHLTNLPNVLSRLQEYGLKANATKCSFFGKKSRLLRRESHRSRCLQDRRQNQRCQERTDPFQQDGPEIVTRDGKLPAQVAEQHRSHCEACDEAFNKIKEMMASEYGIRYDPNLSMRLACDASPYGIGAVLSHVTSTGDKRPIAYASRTLNKAKGNYSQLDKEALAFVWAVEKFFHLCGIKFTLITDHQTLKFTFNPSKGSPLLSAARQQRYPIFLSGFN